MLVVPSVAVAEAEAVNGLVAAACEAVSTSDTLPGLMSEVTPSCNVEDKGMVELSAREPYANRNTADIDTTRFMRDLARAWGRKGPGGHC